MYAPLKRRLSSWNEMARGNVIWFFAFLWGLIGAADLVKTEFLPERFQAYTAVRLIGYLSWHTWLIVCLLLLLVLVLEGGHTALEKRAAKLQEERRGMENTHALTIRKMAEEIEQLKNDLESEKNKQKTPDIRARIQQVRVVHSLGSRLVSQLLNEIGKMQSREFEKQPVDVYVQLYMTNQTPNAPVVVRDYQLVVTKGDAQIRGERFTHIEGETLEFETQAFDGYGFNETKRERKTLAPDLSAEINRVPIEYGVARVGWLRFGCKGVEREDVTLDTITLIVVDAFDGRHQATVEPGALFESHDQDF